MRLQLRQRYWCWRTDYKRAKMNEEQAETFNRVAHDMHRVCELVPWAHESWPHACYGAACSILHGTFSEEAMRQMEDYFRVGPYDDCMTAVPNEMMANEFLSVFPGMMFDPAFDDDFDVDDDDEYDLNC